MLDRDLPFRPLIIKSEELKKASLSDLVLWLALADDAVIGTNDNWGGGIKQTSSELIKAARDKKMGMRSVLLVRKRV